MTASIVALAVVMFAVVGPGASQPAAWPQFRGPGGAGVADGENPPLGERVAATPAIADDTLYVRTAGHLYAFATKN